MDPTGTLVIIFIFVFSIVFISKGAGIIKAWIKRNDTPYDQENFERLAKAFIKYKKDSKRRIEKLEAVLEKTRHNQPTAADQTSSGNPRSETIEIDPQAKKNKEKTNSGKMENMLRSDS